MARLPALIDLLTKLPGAERKTLELQARTLREAGLLSPSKRGVGAAAMTIADAAVLLLAHMATDSAASAPEIVQRFSSLTNYLYEDPEYDLLQPRHTKASIMFWPLYSARTSLDVMKIMIENSDRQWNFCRDVQSQSDQTKKSALERLAVLGAQREAFEARRTWISLDRVGRSLTVTIDDIYEHKSSYKPYYSTKYDKDDIFSKRTFSHSWAEFNRYDEDEDPWARNIFEVSGQALFAINQLIKQP